MALQVWLPLNGDLHNQGLSNAEIVTTGATINTSGKIGSCYSFDGSDDLISISCPDLYKTFSGGSQQFSVAFWVYHADSTRAIIFGDYGLTGTISFNIELTTGHQVRFYWNGNPDKNFAAAAAVAASNWTHIVLTYDGSKINIYKNGILQSDRWSGTLATKNKTSGLFYLGRDSRTGTTVLNGRLNDFRIYNHALSIKEVEEISKGLVLHYKLDNNGFGQSNLLSRYVVPGQQAPDVTTTAGRTNYYGDYGIIIPATENADTYFRLFLKEQLIQNEVYTISCNVSGLLNGSVYRFPLFAQGNTSMGVLVLDHNGLCSLTFTMTYSTQTAVTINGETVYICFMDDSGRTIATNQGPITITNFKIEKGSVATSWIPASTDRLYVSLGLNSNIIYDSSGYNHHGEIINNINIESNSPRYNSCIHMSATNQKIKISNFPTSGFGNSYSFVWWEKISSATPMHWGFADGIRLNGMYTGRLWNTGDSSNNPLYTPGTTTQVETPSTGVWHHWAMTGDGTTCKVYQDGVLWGQAKTYKAISGSTIYINGWDSGTSYCSNNASMSDFRIYCTALTAEQIKELYNTSATVDKNGNIYTREVVEK